MPNPAWRLEGVIPYPIGVVPALYALMIRGDPSEPRDPEQAGREVERQGRGQDEPEGGEDPEQP
jgi:hypothetical protein